MKSALKNTRKKREEREAEREHAGGNKVTGTVQQWDKKKKKSANKENLKRGKFTLKWEQRERLYLLTGGRREIKKPRRLTKATLGEVGTRAMWLARRSRHPLYELWCYESSQTTRAPGVGPDPGAGLNWTRCSCLACRGQSQTVRSVQRCTKENRNQDKWLHPVLLGHRGVVTAGD